MSDFKDVLKKLRKSKNMTQNELADKLGVSRSTISCYENGTRFPTSEGYEEIADLFNVDINFLFGKLEIMRPVLYDEYGVEYSVVYQNNECNQEEQKKRITSYYKILDSLIPKQIAEYSKEIAILAHENNDYKLLFDECKKLRAEDVELLYKLSKRLNSNI